MKQFQGLSEVEAENLLRTYGENTVEQKKKQNSLFVAFKKELLSGMTLLLLLACVVSFFLGEGAEALAILFVVLINISFTLFQIYKADTALESLKNILANTCLVLRGGAQKEIQTRFLVPGDVVYLESGARVPADSEVIGGGGSLNESLLTGESALVLKNTTDAKNIFMGTTVAVGELYARVISTGGKTQFGKIASSLETIDEGETSLQKKIKDLTKKIGYVGIAAAVLAFLFSFMREKDIFTSFIFTVSVAVAVVPEGLPIVMTAILGIGVEKMAKKGVVMRRLDAIESLGSVKVLATDKTGTLTQNKMTVEGTYVHGGDERNETLLALGGLYNVSVKTIHEVGGGESLVGDPTEIALYEYVTRTNKDTQPVSVLESHPFTSEKMTRSIILSIDSFSYEIINGAAERVVEITNLSLKEKNDFLSLVEKEASEGKRTIAVCYKEKKEQQYTLAGFYTLVDPLREGIREAIDKATAMGIRTVLVTGDNPFTAESIAVEAGIAKKGDGYIIGSDFEKFSDEELLEKLDVITIFARMTPAQKLRLVGLLQQKFGEVAVTGDGVNDAPALKKADVGIAMGKSGTETAKDASDAVLTDDKYSTLVEGIYEGRAIIKRIELATVFFLAGNFGELFYILGGLLFGYPLISPLQLLFINVITDAIPAIALAYSLISFESVKKHVVRQEIVPRSQFVHIKITAFIIAISAGGVAYIFRQTPEIAKELSFILIIFMQQLILVDLWAGRISLFSDWKKVFNKTLIFPTLFTASILYVFYHISFLSTLLSLNNFEPTFLFFIGGSLGIYLLYVFVRILTHRISETKRLLQEEISL